MTSGLVTLADILNAADVIRPHVHRTPILTSAYFDALFDASIYFKCENFQKVGAFKARGACNAVLTLTTEEARRGVATHSSGNHAQALAYAARIRGIPCHIVMPTTAPDVKRRAVLDYGAIVIDCDPTIASRERTLEEVITNTGAHPVPPYNDARVIAGQGTAALELLTDIPDLDVIMAPVGGGGLMSGTAACARGLEATSGSSEASASRMGLPRLTIYGTEPEIADDARRSLATGEILPSGDPMTVADGLRGMLGPITYRHLQALDVKMLTASEESIQAALGLVLERMKIVVEASSVVTIAALLEQRSIIRGKRVGILLSGGNLDMQSLWKRSSF